jgi:hypothetical protein
MHKAVFRIHTGTISSFDPVLSSEIRYSFHFKYLDEDVFAMNLWRKPCF